jgi:arginyl-tRNA synthetase
VVAFPFSKISKKAPDQTAKEIGQELSASIPDIETIDSVKGF